MSSADPRVGIVIPAFNARATIARAVRSALAVEGAEVVVVDDGSTDATARLAREAGARVVSQDNQGPAAARRAGEGATSAEFLVYLDADDQLVADGVHESLRRLSDDERLGVVAGRVIGVTGPREALLERRFTVVNTTSLLRTGFGPWPPAAAVMRRSALEAARAHPVPALGVTYAEDFELLLRLSLVAAIGMHDRVSARYTLFEGRAASAVRREIEDKERLRGHYAEHAAVPITVMRPREIEAATRLRLARIWFARRRPVQALAYAIGGALRAPDVVVRKALRRGSGS